MPKFITSPNYVLDTIMEFSRQGNIRREQEEAEREASRERKKQRAIAIGGAVVGGFAGAGALGGTVATATAPATGLSALVGGSAAAGAVTGLAFGSQVGQGDFAGAAKTALGQVTKFEKIRDQVALYGSRVTPEQEKLFNAKFAEHGTSPQQLLKEGVEEPLKHLQKLQNEAADEESQRARLKELGYNGTYKDAETMAAQLEAGVDENGEPTRAGWAGFLDAQQDRQEAGEAAQAKAKAGAKIFGESKAIYEREAELAGQVPQHGPGNQQKITQGYATINDVERGVRRGEITLTQAAQVLAKVSQPPAKQLLKKKGPPDLKEFSKKNSITETVYNEVTGEVDGYLLKEYDPPNHKNPSWDFKRTQWIAIGDKASTDARGKFAKSSVSNKTRLLNEVQSAHSFTTKRPGSGHFAEGRLLTRPEALKIIFENEDGVQKWLAAERRDELAAEETVQQSGQTDGAGQTQPGAAGQPTERRPLFAPGHEPTDKTLPPPQAAKAAFDSLQALGPPETWTPESVPVAARHMENLELNIRLMAPGTPGRREMMLKFMEMSPTVERLKNAGRTP